MTVYKLKMVMLGDTGVGKSCLVSRFIYDSYNDYINATIGAQFMTKEFADGKYRIDIWDTAGQERFRSLIPMYVKGANILLIVLDVTTPKDQIDAQIDYWFNYIKEHIVGNSHYRIILVYNKIDIKHNFKVERDERFYESIEVSCKTGLNLKHLESIIFKAVGEIEPQLQKYTPLNKKNLVASKQTYSEMVMSYCSIV